MKVSTDPVIDLVVYSEWWSDGRAFLGPSVLRCALDAVTIPAKANLQPKPRGKNVKRGIAHAATAMFWKKLAKFFRFIQQRRRKNDQ